MKIKVQFGCDEKYYSKITRELKKLAQMEIVKPLETYSNYCGMYIGDKSTVDNMGALLCEHYEEGKVTFFDISPWGRVNTLPLFLFYRTC